MSAVAKQRIERIFKQMKQASRPAAMRRPPPDGPATEFARDPDRVAGAPEWPTDDLVPPAARLLMDGEPFEFEVLVRQAAEIYNATPHPCPPHPSIEAFLLRCRLELAEASRTKGIGA